MTGARVYTRSQVAQLLALRDAGAFSEASPLGPYDGLPFNSMVLGRLRDLELTTSKVLRHGKGGMGGQVTVHWLTAGGREEADRLAERV